MENAYRNKYSAELYLAEGKNHILNLAQQEDISLTDLQHAKNDFKYLIERWEIGQRGYEIMLPTHELANQIAHAFNFWTTMLNVLHQIDDRICFQLNHSNRVSNDSLDEIFDGQNDTSMTLLGDADDEEFFDSRSDIGIDNLEDATQGDYVTVLESPPKSVSLAQVLNAPIMSTPYVARNRLPLVDFAPASVLRRNDLNLTGTVNLNNMTSNRLPPRSIAQSIASTTLSNTIASTMPFFLVLKLMLQLQ